MRAPIPVVLLALAVSACTTALRWDDAFPESGSYTVRQGDSLYAIALRFDLSPDDLSVWNDLGGGSLIFPGQELRLTAPSSGRTKKVATVSKRQDSATTDWLWPARGKLAARYNAPDGIGKGIDIAGKEGDAVFAAAGGKVVYSGGGLIGYGNLIIVKHSRSVLSAYGYNSELLVGEGALVTAGQRIANMGLGPGQRPLLHFEIRLDGKPANPLDYLPAQ